MYLIKNFGVFIIIGVIGRVIIYQNMTPEQANTTMYSESPEIVGQPLKGDSNALVTITEFGDYKCPSCKTCDENIIPLLEKDYLQERKVNMTYINTPFHGEESELAAMAGEFLWETHPDSFWDFHSNIFPEQPAIQSHDDKQ